MKRVTSAGLVLLLVGMAGCGGGSEPGDTGTDGRQPTPPAPTTVPTPSRRTIIPRLTLNWGARSRGIGNLSSALSAVVHLQGAKQDGSDLTFTVNRITSPGSYAIAVKAPEEACLGQWPFSVTFYAQPDGTGAIVGIAQSQVEVGGDGTLPDVSVATTIKRIDVPDGQLVRVGERYDLHWSAYDQSGNLVAVTPGSATITLMDDTDCVRLMNGQLEGLAPGMASVVVLVDGVSSDTVPVHVNGTADAY